MITKRDLFATGALIGLLAHNGSRSVSQVAARAFQQADEMLVEAARTAEDAPITDDLQAAAPELLAAARRAHGALEGLGAGFSAEDSPERRALVELDRAIGLAEPGGSALLALADMVEATRAHGFIDDRDRERRPRP